MYEAGRYYLRRKGYSEPQTIVECAKNQIARIHQPTTHRNTGRIDQNSKIRHMHRQLGQRFINEKASTNIRVREKFCCRQLLSQQPASSLTKSASTNSFFQR